MDKSNPTLYGKLQAFKENSAAGLDAFVQAQSVSIPPPLTKTFYENNADSKSDYFHSEESSTLKATSSASSELWDPDEIESEFYNPFTEGLGYFLLKFPFLILVCAIISIELLFYFTVRQSVAVWEYAFVWRGKLGSFRRQLRTAQSYEGWKNVAKELDTYIGNDKWRKQPSKAYYDHKLISDLLEKMSGFRKTGQMEKLMEVLLQAGLRNNVGNIDSVRLYSNTYYGTKKVIEKFLKEGNFLMNYFLNSVVTVSLDYIGSSPNLKSSEKKRFFKAAFRNYGRSALCLSGGATLAYFHFGVVRTLLDNNMLPKIITGTSAGSMIAAMIACRSDSELRELLNPDMYLVVNACEGSFVEKLQYLIANGKLFEARKFAEKSQWVTKGHTTFLEAYRMTGKILNITAVPYNSYGPTKFLNYLTTPNVVIWSAVMASSSVPCVLEPITLMIKMEDGTLEPYLGAGVKWRDGSIKTDIPIESLNAQFNVKYTIVSQANPHVAIFYYENRGGVGSPAAHRNGRGWRGGFMASSLEHYLKLDLKKWLRVLRDLELLPFIMKQDLSNVWLQKFDGNATIFPSFSLYNYLHMLDDPTLERMEGYFRSGTIKTWPKLHKIHNHTRIEHSIFYWLKILYNTKEDYDIPQNAHILPNGKPDDEYTTLSTDSGIGTEVQYLNPEDLHNNLLDFVMGICGEELSIKH